MPRITGSSYSRCHIFLVLAFTSACTSGGGTSTTASSNWSSNFSSVTTPVSNGELADLATYGGQDLSGNLYISGTAGGSWVMLASTDGGGTWAQAFSQSSSSGFGMATDSLGNVFAAGSSGSSGQVKKLPSGSSTWSTVYTGQAAGDTTYLEAIAVDASDNIYAAGGAQITLTSQDSDPDRVLFEWFVIKSTDHGATWNVVDQYYLPDHNYTQATGILAAASGNIYVYGGDAVTNSELVRMSSNGGSTWTNVFQDVNGTILSLTEWNSGLILNENYYANGSSPPSMRVRGTTDSFVHMKTIDSYSPNGATTVQTGFMKVDSRDYVYYSGRYVDASGLDHLILRATRGDGTWSTVDDLAGANGDTYYADDVLISGTKILNIAGFNSQWIVRNASLNSTTTFSPASMANGSDFTSPIPGGAKRIFMTWTSHDGQFGTTPANAIAAADALCNSDTNKPAWNSSATYKAMLVNSARVACTTPNCSGGLSEHTDWVFSPNTTYVSFEGATIGTTDSNGLFSSLSRGVVTNTVYFAWTALNAVGDWTEDNNPNFGNNNGDICQDWTSNDGSGADYSSYWDMRQSTLGDIYIYAWKYCNTAQQLLCVEQ